jgi:alginate O-acetyltransferase complex protein AlgI
MLFNSLEFAIFFPLVTIIYFLLPHKFRWMLLLTASCVFYMFFIPAYIFILAITIIIDYFAGIWIYESTGRRKKLFLLSSIVSTCLVLFIFKYYDFFITNFNGIASLIGWNYSIATLEIILPIGLSFHTFQSLSYVIEVYRGKQIPERNFGIYSLYVMFYPQLVAGPIERPQNLLWQFHTEHHFDYNRIVNGLKLMAWGLFKKVLIADRLSVFVDQVYNSPTEYQGLPLVIATIFFTFQIYCDFSGYSDIAIGSAQVMGFKLMSNFNRPYFSKSISEFWKRWHISLSTWFKDYLYIPLGGNRVNKSRWYFNLFFTFMVSGLWHGANWTFLAWGALHGCYLVLALVTQSIRNKLTDITSLQQFPTLFKLLQIGFTFILVAFAWIFFRANNIHDAWYIVKNMFHGFPGSYLQALINSDLRAQMVYLNQGKNEFTLALVCILFMEMIHLLQRQKSIREMLNEKPWFVRWSFYYCIMITIMLYGVFNKSQFIYFQF